MRRKNWKTKKLDKDFYDSHEFRSVFRLKLKKSEKINKITEKDLARFRLFLHKRILFLRKLYMKKARALLKKNILPNYIFYANFLSDFRFYKTKNILFKYINKNNNLNTVYPEFAVKKKIFYDYNKYKNLESKYNFFYISYNTKYIKKMNNLGDDLYGVNNHLFNSKNELVSFNEEEEFKNLICLKFLNEFKSDLNEINYYFVYNLHVLNSIEIYKIFIILYLNNILKL